MGLFYLRKHFDNNAVVLLSICFIAYIGIHLPLFMPNMFLFDPAAEAWESDDNLSDGGDFFEEEDFQPSPLDCLKASIPVVPAVQVMAVMFSVIVRDLN